MLAAQPGNARHSTQSDGVSCPECASGRHTDASQCGAWRTLRDKEPAQEPLAQRRGRAAEDWGAHWLQSRGLQMLGRNLRVRGGEIDLLMRDGATWVFVEVKFRSRRDFGGASGSVDGRKQRRIRHAATCLLQERFAHGRWPTCRFDVLLIEVGDVRWIRGAF